MAEAFVQVLAENLNSFIQKELGLLWGVDKEVKKLSSLLSTIQAVLEDAEEKQVKDKAIRNWLRNLKEAAYKVDDILDECATEAFRLESKGHKVNVSFLNSFCPNYIIFRHEIGNRMREIRERLDEIAEERVKFHLSEVISERQAEVTEARQTGSIITQSHVYGRQEDKEKVVECLVESVTSCDSISIYPIVGLGGLGKTTLAQVVYNDERVKSHFELRIWVCISEDFSVRRIIRSIIESATGTVCEALDLDPLQSHLQKILNGKRYLLVLDDVWSEDQEKWDRLKYVLACGSKGASIIVTTRIKRVASIMGTLPMHHLSGLSDDECWSLFRERAFGQEKEERPSLVALGKQIVKKCGGVPLAVKSLGSLMRFKSEEHEWLSVKESELWDLPQDECSILPALRLSYSHLSSKMRRCFAFCAVFPKDSWIEKEQLIHLWMANGFIAFSRKQEPEDIGNEICNELYSRSFFNHLEYDKFDNIEYGEFKEVVYYQMHDLIHDLAIYVMDDECHILEAKSSNDIQKRMVHVQMDSDILQSYPSSKAFNEVETLRTLVLERGSKRSFGRNRSEFYCDFSRLISLRALSVQGTGIIIKLSSSFRLLKHLRYLDLSYSSIVMLPESVCSLLNLQTLKLQSCYSLRKLPKRMRFLKNLRHLYLTNCYKLYQMPPKIGQITCLKTLPLFIVGNRRGFHLDELKGLNLGGELQIKHLDRVGNVMGAKEANLVGKRNLRSLELSWDHGSESEVPEKAEKVLEALEPPPNLERLVIDGYKGVQFPLWMNEQVLSNVVSIEIYNSPNCLQLPCIGKLHFLRYLIVSRMTHVLYIDSNSQVGGMRGFPSLEKLFVVGLSNLHRLTREDGKELLPCLTKLEIANCPKLTLPCLPSLKYLEVIGCSTELMLRSISNLRSLTVLSVSGNDESTYLPHEMLQNCTSLKSIKIENFSKLKGLSDKELEQLSGLERLILIDCPVLVALPDCLKYLSSLQHFAISGGNVGCSWTTYPSDEFKDFRFSPSTPPKESFSKLAVLPEALRHMPALQSLCIACYPDLASLPNWLGDLTSLQTFQICECPKLSSLPASIQGLNNLQELSISHCPELVKRCEKETGEDWYKIAHVPKIELDTWRSWPMREAQTTNCCLKLRDMTCW